MCVLTSVGTSAPNTIGGNTIAIAVRSYHLPSSREGNTTGVGPNAVWHMLEEGRDDESSWECT